MQVSSRDGDQIEPQVGTWKTWELESGSVLLIDGGQLIGQKIELS